MTTVEECGPLTAAALRLMTEGEAPARRFLDVLPGRGGKPGGGLEWMPEPNAPGSLVGFVRLTMPDDVTCYSVSEGRAHAGRAFVLTKAGGKGTDKRRDAYAVYCVGARAISCECASRTPFCKHRDAADVLLANGWL